MKLVLGAVLALACSVTAIRVGDTLSNAVLDYGFPPSKVDVGKRIANKNVIVLSLPGAFTPTWSNVQVPGYLKKVDDLKAVGVDELIIFCANDGAVMDAWAKDQDCENHDFIKFMADPTGAFIKSLDIELNHPGPQGKGLYGRGKRTAIYFVNGIAKVVRVAEKIDDPAGDDFPDVTLAEAMIEAISALGPHSSDL